MTNPLLKLLLFIFVCLMTNCSNNQLLPLQLICSLHQWKTLQRHGLWRFRSYSQTGIRGIILLCSFFSCASCASLISNNVTPGFYLEKQISTQSTSCQSFQSQMNHLNTFPHQIHIHQPEAFNLVWDEHVMHSFDKTCSTFFFFLKQGAPQWQLKHVPSVFWGTDPLFYSVIFCHHLKWV